MNMPKNKIKKATNLGALFFNKHIENVTIPRREIISLKPLAIIKIKLKIR